MVSRRPFVPKRGNLIWLDFNPVRGHEQGDTRPAPVLSRERYNDKTSLAIVCPVTSRAKGYEFEVELPHDGAVEGVVLADHVRNLDWRARHARFAGRAPTTLISRVGDLVAALAQD